MWWIFLTLVLILSYLLFARVLIEIDTTKEIYCLHYGWFFKIKLVIHDNSPIFRIHFFGVKKNISIQKRRFMTFRKLVAILKSFKLKKCHISIDTGNMPLNGILFPVFFLIGRYLKKPIGINFIGENSVILHLENTLARILWAYFKS
jgi:hypothetical protein